MSLKKVFLEISGLKVATLTQVFPVNFAKFPRTPFLKEHLGWLLLNVTLSVLLADKSVFKAELKPLVYWC